MSKALGESSLGCTTPTSSASPRVSKKREKTVPHYLRASTGSCHDLCKYGHKNPSEEEQRFSGGRRKKLPTHLNNLTLHRSAFLDRPKDVRSRRLSLAKSSISLSEPERVASKLTSGIRKGSASNEHLVLLTTTSAEHKILNSDGSKKHSMVAEKTPTNLRHSNGVPKHDRKKAFPHQTATNSAKVKVPEKALPEKSRTVDKVPTAKHSLLKSPTSSSTDLNMIKCLLHPRLLVIIYSLQKTKVHQRERCHLHQQPALECVENLDEILPGQAMQIEARTCPCHPTLWNPS
jgi:hypothetical protein